MENIEKVKITNFDYALLKGGEEGQGEGQSQAQEEDKIQVIEASKSKK
jgi:hypothetical protein